MKRIWSKVLLAVLTTCVLQFDVAGQSELPFKEKYERRNIISLQASVSNHFDGAPIINDLLPIKFGSTGFLPQGIDYYRYLGNKSGMLLSVAFFRMGFGGVSSFSASDSYPHRPGDIAGRMGWYLDAAYARTLLDRKNFDVNGIVGLSYRYGNEWVYGFYVHYTTIITHNYQLSDWGMHTGLRTNIALPWNLRASAMMKYTFYLYRYDTHLSPGIEFSNRSTRSRLALQVGLGYSF